MLFCFYHSDLPVRNPCTKGGTGTGGKDRRTRPASRMSFIVKPSIRDQRETRILLDERVTAMGDGWETGVSEDTCPSAASNAKEPRELGQRLSQGRRKRSLK